MLHSAGQDIGEKVLGRVCGVFPRPVFGKKKNVTVKERNCYRKK